MVSIWDTIVFPEALQKVCHFLVMMETWVCEEL